jgi:bifunctional DNA-binding transcriptional regulator/antitoxin component of YhaV-PrlF toxin-antitoxin module
MSGELRHISRIFISGRISATLIIPIEIARRHGLEKPSNVIVEETSRGILIRKLEVQETR